MGSCNLTDVSSPNAIVSLVEPVLGVPAFTPSGVRCAVVAFCRLTLPCIGVGIWHLLLPWILSPLLPVFVAHPDPVSQRRCQARGAE